MTTKRQGYYSQGSRSVITAERKPEWTPHVDKDPFYRTTDILNGAYKKKPGIRLQQGDHNATDLKTIWVNFGETYRNLIVERIGPGRDQLHDQYRLKCGHEWEGKTGHVTNQDYGHCWTCGTEQAYLGFEHEWQHIIFKSDLAVRKLFVESYAEDWKAKLPDIDVQMLQGFLNLLTNAFDDIRCNSLWEKIYPGSAAEIWKRWKRLTEERGEEVSKNFLDFVFAVAFDVPTDPDGEFEPLRQILQWGVHKVKYRGFMNMLVDVRVVVDYCVGAMISKFQRPPQLQAPPQQQAPPQSGGGSDRSDAQGLQGEESQEGETGSDSGAARSSGSSDDADTSQGEGEEAGVDAPQHGDARGSVEGVPSASNIPGREDAKAEALNKMMGGSSPLDEGEKHLPPTPEQLADAKASQSVMAGLRRALQADVTSAVNLDQLLPENVVDQDMQQAIDQLMNGIAVKSLDSQLTGDAKSKLLLINVTPDSVKQDTGITLSPEDENNVKRMRAAFFRALGRQKAKRSMEGTVIDVPAYINYKLDRQDPEIFENDAPQQGFAYSILCDMSGSMQGTFVNVCHAVEMLKKALHFPFVNGNLWGFRGGQTVANRPVSAGEVWIYRYGKDVKGYTGFQRVPTYKSVVTVPVGCGGSTPMNPAINVTVTHLQKKVPAGMAKRLFLLTDGSPCSTRVTGSPMPDWLLRKYVAKEINLARKHGIQVYTLIIGHNAIPEDQCREMFGLPRFWKRVEEREKTGSVLAQLVLDNFQKYIKARG